MITGIVSFLLMGIFYLRHQPPPKPQGMTKPRHAPARQLETGPVATGIRQTEIFDDVIIETRASRIWVKKTKTFGFENNLLKKMAALDFTLSITREDRQIISIAKKELEMPCDTSPNHIISHGTAAPPKHHPGQKK